MKVGMIVVAGGKGLRAGGDVPKQLRTFLGKPLYLHALGAALAHAEIGPVVLVIPEGFEPAFKGSLPEGVTLTCGGETRSASVLAGLKALELNGDDKVLVHDAARPGLEASTISAVTAALDSADAAAPALPVLDALKRWRDGAAKTVDRSDLYRVQTPQAFRYGQLLKLLQVSDADLVDDLAAIEADGGIVELIPGSEKLAKVTLAEDFVRMENLLCRTAPAPRVGSGFDVHAFGEGDHLTLCGVEIAHSHALSGHSDADVAWHALTDAILGALALGDIGDHFSPSDPQWKGAASSVFLSHAVKLASERGFRVESCDLTIICEAPKVGPHRGAMRTATARVLDRPVEMISVKATTTERLGFTGRGEGIAAQAMAVLMPLQSAD